MDILDTPELFQKEMDYITMLDTIYEKYKSDEATTESFNRHPYALGLLHATLLRGYHTIFSAFMHFGQYPCDTSAMYKHLEYIEAFYKWIYDGNSSYSMLSEREQEHMRTLFGFIGLTNLNMVESYICGISFDYIDVNKLPRSDRDDVYPPSTEEEFIKLFTSKNAAFIQIKNHLSTKKIRKDK